jgi:hypothetical protein
MLTIRLLKDVSDVNHFSYTDQGLFVEGDTPTIHFQLADGSVEEDLRPIGRRYLPAAGATCQVVLKGIDSSQDITATCAVSFAEDRSIWNFSILSTDVIVDTRAMKVVLTEGAVVKHAFVNRALVFTPANPEF